jgi:hypothetical protein
MRSGGRLAFSAANFFMSASRRPLLVDENTRPTSVLSFRAVGQLWRAVLVYDDDDLTADESASTLFRFFRSRHVIDLKLIVTLTIFALLIHFLTVFVFAIGKPLAHLVIALGEGRFAAAQEASWIMATRGVRFLGKYFAPGLAVYGGIMAWAYLGAAKRLGVVDLFACEIGTLCRVGTIFSIGSLYVSKFGNAKQIAEGAEKHHVEHMGERHPAKQQQHAESFVSQEDYFPVFAGNSSDLQALEALVVAHITEFYTYMKASRDLMRKLAETDPLEMPSSFANLIYITFLGYEAGRQSISQLIEFEPTRAEDTVVMLLTELVCYKFLLEYFFDKADDVRHRRLVLRENDYKDAVPKLCRKINSDHGANERYWAPAKETTDELGKRYQETFNETIGEAIARIERLEQHAHSS